MQGSIDMPWVRPEDAGGTGRVAPAGSLWVHLKRTACGRASRRYHDQYLMGTLTVR
jgi:hypothetical protein